MTLGGATASVHFPLQSVGHILCHRGIRSLAGAFEHGAAHNVTKFCDDGARFNNDNIDTERFYFQPQAVGPALELMLGRMIP